MHAVAGGAGQVARFVRAALPAGVRAAAMAIQAGGTGFRRRGLSEPQDVALRIVVDMGLAGAVTAFAVLLRRRRPRVERLRVLGALERGLHVGMTQQARVAAGIG